MTQLIDGSAIAEQIRIDIKQTIATNGYKPGLAVILVGEDPASQLYVRLKEKACLQVGIEFHKYFMPENTPMDTLMEVIAVLNADDETHGILVQLPLPKHLDEDAVIAAIDPKKDVDGFGPKNREAFLTGKPALTPGLVNGILTLITNAENNITGKKAVVIANSDIFTLPMAYLLEKQGCNVSVANPLDSSFTDLTKHADIIVVAVGKKWFLTKEMIKIDSIVIDVGTNKEGGVTYGDVDLSVLGHAGFLSPVPGGVGPMTIAMLLKNTLTLYEQQQKN